mgnify:CR=1 FL=1
MTIKLPGPSFWQKNDAYKILEEDCKNVLETDRSGIIKRIHLTFLDPPFNQGKEYDSHDDNMSEKDYWDWMTRICNLIKKKTVKGGAIYFMQREKNAGSVIRTLVDSGWTFQNLIIWRKKLRCEKCLRLGINIVSSSQEISLLFHLSPFRTIPARSVMKE